MSRDCALNPDHFISCSFTILTRNDASDDEEGAHKTEEKEISRRSKKMNIKQHPIAM